MSSTRSARLDARRGACLALGAAALLAAGCGEKAEPDLSTVEVTTETAPTTPTTATTPPTTPTEPQAP